MHGIYYHVCRKYPHHKTIRWIFPNQTNRFCCCAPFQQRTLTHPCLSLLSFEWFFFLSKNQVHVRACVGVLLLQREAFIFSSCCIITVSTISFDNIAHLPLVYFSLNTWCSHLRCTLWHLFSTGKWIPLKTYNVPIMFSVTKDVNVKCIIKALLWWT